MKKICPLVSEKIEEHLHIRRVFVCIDTESLNNFFYLYPANHNHDTHILFDKLVILKQSAISACARYSLAL